MKYNYTLRTIKPAIERIAKACSSDETRPVLHLIRATITAGSIRLESADGFRAHRQDLFNVQITPPLNDAGAVTVLISAEQITAILKYKITRKDDPIITLDTKSGQILIDGKTTAGSFDTKTQYPDIDALFPKQQPTIILTVNPAKLLQAVKTARVFAREGSNVCRLHCSDSIVVHGHSEELGESFTVVDLLKLNRIQIHDLPIAFNCDFLIDYLKIATGPVEIKLYRSNSPAVFTDSEGFTALVMPMHIDFSGTITPADIQPESAYNTAGAYVYPRDLRTNRHPDPAALHNGHIPAYYVKPEPVESEPRESSCNFTIDDSIFTSAPEPGACDYDISTIWSYLSEGDHKRDNVKIAVFHFTNPRLNKDAPIPVDFSIPSNRHPLFAGGDILTIGECSQCIDTQHHVLRKGICIPCDQANHELSRSYK